MAGEGKVEGGQMECRNCPYCGYIRKLFEFGIIEGYPDGTFRPVDYVTREQMDIIIDKVAALFE